MYEIIGKKNELKKNEIMPFAAILMDLQIIRLVFKNTHYYI